MEIFTYKENQLYLGGSFTVISACLGNAGMTEQREIDYTM